MRTNTTFRRRAAQFVVAGALVTIPLSTLAVTANAQTPTDAPVEFEAETITTASPDAAAVSDRRLPALPTRPGPGPDHSQTIIIPGPGANAVPALPYPGGPRVEYREGPEQGPTLHLHHRPSTGSAGSS
ncbi:hypothetical protein [Nocardia sp. XZ_19_385]|uniref:hypothetical protein n=1 Tax=Nocardia sp. XZ_19_385 TaxID=2769488 RepID=UPI00188F11C7|nr:hypothetical protein [Nocardia sp. XZ_19_385]